MAIEPLLEALGSDAERDVRTIAEAALAEAARIRAEAEARVARRCALALEAREAELRGEADARRARALRETRASLLQARNAFLERVFAATAAQLRGVLSRPERTAALLPLVNEALEYVPSGAVVRCRPDLVERLRLPTNALGAARLVPDAAAGEGAIIQAPDGSVTIDNTLENRLRWMRPTLSIELLAQFESTQ